MDIVNDGDILILLSNSGESHELSDLIDFAKKKILKLFLLPLIKRALYQKTRYFDNFT